MNTPLDPAMQHQCERMVADLCDEFAGAFDRTTIEDVMSDSVDRVVETATVFDFVPLMAYRFTLLTELGVVGSDTTTVGSVR